MSNFIPVKLEKKKKKSTSMTWLCFNRITVKQTEEYLREKEDPRGGFYGNQGEGLLWF